MLARLAKNVRNYFTNLTNNKGVQRFNTTLTDSKGNNLPPIYSAETTNVIEKVFAKETLRVEEISLLMTEIFSQPKLETTTYKLREIMFRDAVFVVDEINLTSTAPGAQPTNLIFKMKELVFGTDIEIKVSAHNFHEFFITAPLVPLDRKQS